MRVATILHVLFGVDHDYTVSSTISDAAVVAALDIVHVCNEHTKIIAGRLSTAPSTAVMTCKNNYNH